MLHFSDSTSWNTNFEPSDATEAQLGSLVQAVAEWSGVPISELPVLTREDYD